MPTFISRLIQYEVVTVPWQFAFNIFGGFLGSIIIAYLQDCDPLYFFICIIVYFMLMVIPFAINIFFQSIFITKTKNRFIRYFIPLLLLQALFFLLYLVETIVNIFYLSLYEFLGISTVIIFPAFVSALICFSIERLYKKQQFAIHNNNILDDNFINNKPDVNNE